MKNIFSKFSFYFLCTALFCGAGVSTTFAQWVQGGTPPANPRSIVINGSNMFIGGYGGGVALSTDLGTTWTTKNAGLGNTGVWSVYVSGTNLLAGTDGGGIYLSTNNGTTWTNPLPSAYVRGFASDGAGNLYAAGYPSGVWRSTNNGASWTVLATPAANLLSISVIGSNIFVGANGAGIYRSSDGGTTWTQPLTASTSVWSFATIGSTIFAGATTGFYRSTDNGLTWTLVSTPGSGYQAVALVATGTILYIGTDTGVKQSIDNGATWNTVNTGTVLASGVVGLATDGVNLYAGSYYYFGPSGFWRRPLTEMIPSPPTVTTGAATNVTTSTATLNGSVTANGSSTTVTFQYGVTTSYGSTATATQSPVTGNVVVAVSAALTGLTSATVYHYRTVGVNANGTTYGSDMTFSTPVIISGNAGIASAVLSWTDVTPKTTTADGTGAYSITVPYNWSGTITPTLTGYTFTPASLPYVNVTTDQLNQNYLASITLFTISGNAGAAGAVLSWTDGTPKTFTADGTGAYSISVSYNWSGTITPSLAGYIFTPTNRVYANVLTAQTLQNYTAIQFLTANLKVFLQGPYNNAGAMTTSLSTNGFIPLTSETAYPAATFGYTARSVASVPAGVVDWVLVELRTGTAAATKVFTLAGFLLANGTIVDTNGVSPLKFSTVNAGNYYVVVRHRNHLAIMSAGPVALNGTSALYDFTTAQTQAFGTNPMVALTGGGFGLAAGTNDGIPLITTNDFNAIGSNLAKSGYYTCDQNLNGIVFVEDYNFVGTNLLLMSQVP
jgi:hypothetical protein